jgi:parvulin-like peptidyl-prolyl isomerase
MTRAFLGFLVVFSCSTGQEARRAPASSSQNLPVGIVATVGSLTISADAVGAVAAVQRIAPREAAELLIGDALLANGAIQVRLDHDAFTQAAERGLLARARLEQLRIETAETEPNDAEVEQATARHFFDLDRPEAFRVVHAVLRVADRASPAEKTRARAAADRLLEKVSPARDEPEFRRLAESFSERSGFDLVIETAKPVAADGRIVDPSPQPDRYVAPFARAASHLSEPGQKSPVVATEYGYHVMMLLERTAPHVVPLDERKRMLRDEIMTERANRAKKQLMDRLRAATPPAIERSAEGVLSTILGSNESR